MRLLTGESIKKFLNTEGFGKTIYSFEEVGSTNEVASELARNGAPEGTVVIADTQTKGKGRLDRKWVSPPKDNLYISIVFRPQIISKDAPILTLVISIALAEKIRAEGTDALIKWPNDILIDSKKVAGVLTEMEPRGDGVDYVIVGIGVNLNISPEDIKKEMGEIAEIATSLREATGKEVDRAKFTADLIREVEDWYKKFLGKGKSLIINEWMKRWGAANSRVRASFDGKTIEGIATGIDQNGYLIIKKDDGEIERIIAGDVVII